MKAAELVRSIKNDFSNFKRDGITELKVEDILSFLKNIETLLGDQEITLTDIELENYKARLGLWNEQIKVEHAMSLEGFRSVIQAGQSSLKTIILINGGAAVALLAFLGKLMEQNPKAVPFFAGSLKAFIIGVFTAAMASGITYLSQWFYFGGANWKKSVGFWLNIFAIIFSAVSLIMFIWGGWIAYDVFIETTNYFV